MEKLLRGVDVVRLDVGAQTSGDGWFSVDFAGRPDIQADARLLEPIPDHVADEVRCWRMLEYFNKHEAPQVLAALHRVMKYGATLEITVLHFPDILKGWLAADGMERLGRPMDLIFGFTKDHPQAQSIGYDEAIMRRLLTNAGFVVTDIHVFKDSRHRMTPTLAAYAFRPYMTEVKDDGAEGVTPGPTGTQEPDGEETKAAD